MTGDFSLELCQAAKEGDHETVMSALSSGADPNTKSQDWNKTRPIILAAAAGHVNIVKTLLADERLDPNLTDELFGNTALIDASYAGNSEVVEELVADPRTDINYKTERSGLTALMQAARYGHSKVVRSLVTRSPAGVNIQSGGGCTALMLACMAPHQAVLHDGEMIKILLDVPGIDLDIKDNSGKTAQQWARDKELFLIEKLIVERLESQTGDGNKAEDLEVKVRELTERLKVSDESNTSLRNTVRELKERIRVQDEEILRINKLRA